MSASAPPSLSVSAAPPLACIARIVAAASPLPKAALHRREVDGDVEPLERRICLVDLLLLLLVIAAVVVVCRLRLFKASLCDPCARSSALRPRQACRQLQTAGPAMRGPGL